MLSREEVAFRLVEFAEAHDMGDGIAANDYVDTVMGIQADALSNVLQRNTELQAQIVTLKAQRSKYSGW